MLYIRGSIKSQPKSLGNIADMLQKLKNWFYKDVTDFERERGYDRDGYDIRDGRNYVVPKPERNCSRNGLHALSGLQPQSSSPHHAGGRRAGASHAARPHLQVRRAGCEARNGLRRRLEKVTKDLER